MYFIVPFIFIFILVVICLLLFTGGFLVFSSDKIKTGSPAPRPKVKQPIQSYARMEPEKPKQELKPYIDLNGRHIELDKSEVAKAKRDNFKIIYK